jgi:uncharacterized integral membrane protein (TIGR00697 family)
VTLDARLRLFLSLSAVFIASLIVGDLIGGKLLEPQWNGSAIHLFGGEAVIISVGMIPFPVTFLLTDLLNEFYGKQAARAVTWVGFAMTIFTFVLVNVAVALPIASFTDGADWQGINQGAFSNVFGGGKRILAGSLVAYVIAQFADIGIFHLIKKKSGNRLLWLRATGSTVVSQAIDTVVITVVAWTGTLPTSKIIALIATSYVVKLLVAISLTPAIYAGHAVVEKVLKIPPVKLDAEGNVAAAEPLTASVSAGST